MKHYNIRVKGTVQGVWYRDSARRKALELGVNGFVRNEDDGSVYIEAEGEEEALKKLTDWCRKGPERAQVDEVEVEEGAIKNFNGFERRRL